MKRDKKGTNLPKKKLINSKIAFYSLALSLILFALSFILVSLAQSNGEVNEPLFAMGLLIGTASQLVDGALGMSYGITATTLLLSNGIPPAIATGSVHIAEIFTTGAAGLSHWKMGNINSKLFKGLIIPGIIGGVLGVFLITSINGNLIRPWVSGYLIIMGFYIFMKAFKRAAFNSIIKRKKIVPLAFIGGFADSVGGGGWGPVVTSTLLGSGHEPKKTIGSVNSAEFFITIITGFTFSLIIGVGHWEIVAGLIISGMFIAPFSAKILSIFPIRPLMAFVGCLVMFLSALNIYKSLF